MKIKIAIFCILISLVSVAINAEQKIIITTSPYIGLKSAFDASDLIPNSPTINTDLFLLKQNQQLECRSCSKAKLFADRSVIEIGGGLEGQLVTGLQSKKRPSTDLDLTRADIDLLAHISPWATGFMAIAYDNSPLLPIPGGLRVSNSRFFLSRGFVTVGNLNNSPIYATFGQMYVPFGRYASNLLSPPVTLKLGRTTGRTFLLGYNQHGLNGSVYAFHGDSHGDETGLNQWGINTSYQYTYQDNKLNFGAGYIADIIDAKGMRNEWLECGSGITGNLAKHVPAIDFHGEFSKGPYDLFAEYIAATRSFDPGDLNFHDHGARPQAAHLEAAYHLKTIRPATIGAGYGQSWQTFNIPQKSLFSVYTASFSKNTIETIEYRHNTANKLSNPHKSDSNTVVAQIGFYF